MEPKYFRLDDNTGLGKAFFILSAKCKGNKVHTETIFIFEDIYECVTVEIRRMIYPDSRALTFDEIYLKEINYLPSMIYLLIKDEYLSSKEFDLSHYNNSDTKPCELTPDEIKDYLNYYKDELLPLSFKTNCKFLRRLLIPDYDKSIKRL